MVPSRSSTGAIGPRSPFRFHSSRDTPARYTSKRRTRRGFAPSAATSLSASGPWRWRRRLVRAHRRSNTGGTGTRSFLAAGRSRPWPRSPIGRAQSNLATLLQALQAARELRSQALRSAADYETALADLQRAMATGPK
jgi:hypothetical protein